MAEYLDKPGVERLWQKIKAYVANNVVTPSNITGNAGTATKLQTPRAIDGVTFDGSAARSHYGICSTSAGTAAKSVYITGFTLVTGARVIVRFTYANTASSPTLNVSSTGAKAIYYKNAVIPAGYIQAYSLLELVYDGTYWRVVGDLAQTQIDALNARINELNPKSTWKSIPFTATGTTTQKIVLPNLENYTELALNMDIGEGRVTGLVEIIPLIYSNIRKMVTYDNGYNTSASIVSLNGNNLTVSTVRSNGVLEYDYHNVTEVYAR